MKKLFIPLLLLAFNTLYSQSYKGIIYDQKNETPVVFANIYSSLNNGVISNVEGYFTINLENLTENDSLTISSLGYKNKSIAIKDIKLLDTIFVEEQEQMLDEVVVSANKYSAEQIIQMFKDSIPVRHKLDATKFEIFSRNKSTYMPVENGVELDKSSFMTKAKRKQFNERVENYFNKIRGNVSSSFTDLLYDAYYLVDSTAYATKKQTFLINESKDNSMENIQKNIFKELIEALDSESTFKVRTGILPVEDSLSTEEFIVKDDDKKKDTLKNRYAKSPPRIVSQAQNIGSLEIFEDSKKYNFKLQETSFFNGEIVYVINFSPDKSSAKYEGIAYISAEDFGLLKLEYNLIEGKKEAGVNLKLLLGIKYRVDNSRFQYIFKKNEDSVYYPILFKESQKNYVYFDRSFVFKENNDNKDERIKFKVSLHVESNSLSETEYMVISMEDISNKAINFDTDGYVFLEKIDKYNPDLWKDYNIIEATEEIKKYE